MLILASIEGRIARREVACPCEIAARGLDTAIGLRTGNRFLPRLSQKMKRGIWRKRTWGQGHG